MISYNSFSFTGQAVATTETQHFLKSACNEPGECDILKKVADKQGDNK
ncbi:hypothetical protein KNP414_07487 [Paenibacillus mucilaginosus KNP414]|uniref:Uncharacterized protein n=1 Tax=Paenibacillus mucilaginosus (strain KNP414) TaxID=1036673 RepID=F8F7H2_PAEMK|nr:hypothetical protein KNP414_07487 [Paenibacillus mucilaginosus KNP414]